MEGPHVPVQCDLGLNYFLCVCLPELGIVIIFNLNLHIVGHLAASVCTDIN